MGLLHTRANYPSLTIGTIIGTLLTCVVVMWMNSKLDEAPEHVDLGYDPMYPIHVYLSDTDDPGEIQEIVLDPSSERFAGLLYWLGGIHASPVTREDAPAPFSFEVWKNKPTAQTAILVQHNTGHDYLNTTILRGWHAYKEIDPGYIEEGYMPKSDGRSPFFELKMLVPQPPLEGKMQSHLINDPIHGSH
tara:strand:+ start:68 stop:637 length:570 start_codon:yes stop_codon:yes gene_type:complete